MKVYKLNLYNPLTYVMTILAIPFAFIVSPFIDEKFQSVFHEIKRAYTTTIVNPKKLFITLWIVTELK